MERRLESGLGWTVVENLQATDREILQFSETVIGIEWDVWGGQSAFVTRPVPVRGALSCNSENVCGVVPREGDGSAAV